MNTCKRTVIMLTIFLAEATLAMFVGHDTMGHIPWPLNQSKPWNYIIQ